MTTKTVIVVRDLKEGTLTLTMSGVGTIVFKAAQSAKIVVLDVDEMVAELAGL